MAVTRRPGMLSHQKCNGIYSSYRSRRVLYSHAAELRGDNRLYQWITDFKPFLQWGKPTNLNQGGHTQ